MVGSDFITKDKERALDIYEQVTISWRRPNSIPDSDGFECIYKATKLTKGTYLTVSTTKSDKHDGKIHKLWDTFT